VEKLKERFGFPSGYQTSFLRGQIEDAAHLLFYPYQPILTAKQKLLRVKRIHKLANSLLAQLGRDGVDFPMIEPPGCGDCCSSFETPPINTLKTWSRRSPNVAENASRVSEVGLYNCNTLFIWAPSE